MNNQRSDNTLIAVSAALIALSIAFGAFGAHVLNPGLSEKYIRTLGTANSYFMINSIGLLIVSSLNLDYKKKRTSFVLIAVGIFCFSFSLFGIVLCKHFDSAVPFILGPMTPIGGVILIIGWVYLAISTLK